AIERALRYAVSPAPPWYILGYRAIEHADLDGPGLGAICGASWMVLRSAITGLSNVVLVCTLIMSLAILAFTATDAFYLALPCVFVAGAMMTITGTGAQTLIQAAVDDRMSGRVMALYGMIFRA